MNAVKRIRQHLQFTQRELADVIGVQQTAVGNWEVGTRTPRFEHAQALRALASEHGLDVSLEDLLSGSWEAA